MKRPINIIISSFSDCRQRNGVVTFMEMIKEHSGFFSHRDQQVQFVNYVDFPGSVSCDEQPTSARGFQSFNDKKAKFSTTLLRFFWQKSSRLKKIIKSYLVEISLGAFVLFLCTLCLRGLITAIKARKHETAHTVHFYQDVFSAFFGRIVHERKAKKILMLHAGEDPLYMVFDHFPGMVATRYERWVRRYFDRTINDMDALVTLNMELAQALRSKFPNLEIRCIYNTSPFSSLVQRSLPLEINKRKIEFIAVGSLIYRKGFDLLIDAVAGMERTVQDFIHITIVGAGGEQSRLQATIDNFGINHIIRLNGPSSDVSAHLTQADVFVMTSRDEGLPIALVEAAGFGLPIVSTRVGSIAEVFNDGSAMLVEVNVDSIREILVKIVRGEVNLDKFAENSLDIFHKKLSVDSFLNSYSDLFENVGQLDAS